MELIPVQVTPKEAVFKAAFKADFDAKYHDGPAPDKKTYQIR